MRCFFNQVIVVAVFLTHTNVLFAQESSSKFSWRNIQHKVSIGYNIGATAPFSLPNTIRKIKSYSPLFTPSLGYEATYELSNAWRVGTGLRIESKGMRVTDSVQYFHTIISVNNGGGDDGGSFEGDFTGTNETKSLQTYLTLPVFASYRFHKWDIKVGAYASRLLSSSFEGSVSDGYIRKGNSLGEKVWIDRATFDFADQVRKWDWGLLVGGTRKIDDRWEVSALAQLGLQPLFPDDFRGVGYKLHHMYVNLGGTYRFW
ncbi:porin family protein [Sphingobacterium suaedae]|uniref:Porin family protein n=1 Tax=Sphingobacterium suaedae TaxID=1686402 RepID=A0ABW5KH43_9SPHI